MPEANRGSRLRGKRYWQERRRAGQSGMVAATPVVVCFKCGQPVPASELHKGWCLTCVKAWVDTMDPWLIAQHKDDLPVSTVCVTLVNRIEQLQARVVEAPSDEAFLPLLQFMGHKGIGSQKTWWNTLQALYVFELQTTGEAFRLGQTAANTLHLCGRHAAIQRCQLTGFLSRIHSAGADFKLLDLDRHLREYVRGFIADNALERTIFTYTKTNVDVLARWQYARSLARYGKPHFDRHCPVHWPFEAEINRVEMPDVVMEIGELVPPSMPESLRQDLCQDLVVAVLSGETTIEQLRGSMRFYIQQAFRHHPLKYGRFSLDGGLWYGDDEHDSSRSRALTDEDVDVGRASKAMPNVGWPREPIDQMHGWHHGRNRQQGIATVGQQLREKHDGVAILVGAPPSYDDADIDPEILDVFMAEQTPRWRHKLSD